MSTSQDMGDQYASVYEEECSRYLKLAKEFVESLRNREDRQICMHWVQRLCKLKTRNPQVKLNQNGFLKYFLRVMQIAGIEDIEGFNPLRSFKHNVPLDLASVQDPAWLEAELAVPPLHSEGTHPSAAPCIAHWSKDQRTYIAVQASADKGVFIYMAVSNDPALGWDNLVE